MNKTGYYKEAYKCDRREDTCILLCTRQELVLNDTEGLIKLNTTLEHTRITSNTVLNWDLDNEGNTELFSLEIWTGDNIWNPTWSAHLNTRVGWYTRNGNYTHSAFIARVLLKALTGISVSRLASNHMCSNWSSFANALEEIDDMKLAPRFLKSKGSHDLTMQAALADKGYSQVLQVRQPVHCVGRYARQKVVLQMPEYWIQGVTRTVNDNPAFRRHFQVQKFAFTPIRMGRWPDLHTTQWWSLANTYIFHPCIYTYTLLSL